jgi:hypothetical protein
MNFEELLYTVAGCNCRRLKWLAMIYQGLFDGSSQIFVALPPWEVVMAKLTC